MFCKNCGKEIDQKTLNKLMKPTGEAVLCSKCRQPLDNPEFCGGFWGLIAASEEMQAKDPETGSITVMLDEHGRPVQNTGASRQKTIPGATDADRAVARMLLDQENQAGRSSGAGGRSTQDTRRTEQPFAASPGQGGTNSGRGAGGIAGGTEPPRRRGGNRKGPGSVYKWTALAAALIVAAIVLIVVLPKGGKGEDTEGTAVSTDAGKAAETGENTAPEQGAEDSKQGAPDEEPAKSGAKEAAAGKASKEDQTSTDGNSQKTSDSSSESAEPGYNMIKRHYEDDREIAVFYHDEREVRIGEESSLDTEKKDEAEDSNVEASETFDCIGYAAYGNKNSVVSVTRDEDDQGDWYEKRWLKPDTSSGEEWVLRFDQGIDQGILKEKTIWLDDHDVTITFTNNENNDRVVTEDYSETMKEVGIDGNDIEYQVIEREYDEENRLVRTAFYASAEDLEKKHPAAVEYRGYTPDDYPDLDPNSGDVKLLIPEGEDPAGYYYRDERIYTEENREEPFTVSLNDECRFDRIRYVFEGEPGNGRLAAMAYYRKGKLTAGPGGFALFRCTYEETGKGTMEREDRFFDRKGNPVSISSVEPFLKEDSAFVPGYYSQQFPELVGLSAKEAGDDEDQADPSAGTDDGTWLWQDSGEASKN